MGRFSILVGDITQSDAQAIVNAEIGRAHV